MTVFTDIFTGAPLQPSDVGYTSYTLTADKTLSWPSTSTTSDTVARIMTIVCNGAYSLTFPAANEASTGQDTLITNTGSTTLTVKDSTGATITTVAAGAAKYIYLTDNTTTAGIWAAVAFGVGTSNVDAAVLAGYGLLAVSTTLNQACPVTSISTPTTAGAADRARLLVDIAGITITLPSAATIGNNFFTFIRNGSSGTTTIAPSGGDLIDNGASVALNPAESLMVICSGTAWYTVGWGRSVTFNYTQLTKSVAGGADVTLSAAEAGYKILKFTGLLTANINVVVPTTTTIWYVDNSTTGGYTLTVKTSAGSGVSTTNGTRYVLYGDGTNVVNAVTVTGSFSSFTTGSASAPSITFAADTDTGLYNTAANQVGVAVAGTQVANFTASGAAITGAVSADSAAITGAVSADSADFKGGVSADSAAITGAVSAGSASITGAVSAGSALLTVPLPVTSGGTGTTTNPASAVANTPAGNIAATNVQAAINELDTEKAKSGANSDITSLTALVSVNGCSLTGLLNVNDGADIASATTVDLTAATGNTVRITGTTPITAFTMNAGQQMELVAVGALPLTYHATTMNINGGASYTCSANDRLRVFKDGSGVIQVNVTKQAGDAIADLASQAEAEAGSENTKMMTSLRTKQSIDANKMTLNTEQTATGALMQFTGIPATAKRITVIFNGVSVNGTSNIKIQLGTSASLEGTGYTSTVTSGSSGASTSSSTSGHMVTGLIISANAYSGHIVFTKISGNTWIGSGTLLSSGSVAYSISASTKTLSGALTRIGLFCDNGTDTFDSGTFNAIYE